MPPRTEPDITVTPVPSASMTVRSTGYGVGLLYCSHLRLGRREVTWWFDSPCRRLEEIDESTVTRSVELLGRDCFEVLIRQTDAQGQSKAESYREYFFVDDAGTHWVRPVDGIAASPSDASAWEIQDEEEGVEPFEIGTERPEENEVLSVVDLAIDGCSTRCLRQIFYEESPHYDPCGGDAFRREDGTTIYYRRLLGEGSAEYPALAGAPEYEWRGRTYRVWYSVLLGEEEG